MLCPKTVTQREVSKLFVRKYFKHCIVKKDVKSINKNVLTCKNANQTKECLQITSKYDSMYFVPDEKVKCTRKVCRNEFRIFFIDFYDLKKQ